MRKGFVIFVVLFSVFLVIGCTDYKGQTANTTETPVVTPAETPQSDRKEKLSKSQFRALPLIRLQ